MKIESIDQLIPGNVYWIIKGLEVQKIRFVKTENVFDSKHAKIQKWGVRLSDFLEKEETLLVFADGRIHEELFDSEAECCSCCIDMLYEESFYLERRAREYEERLSDIEYEVERTATKNKDGTTTFRATLRKREKQGATQ